MTSRETSGTVSSKIPSYGAVLAITGPEAGPLFREAGGKKERWTKVDHARMAMVITRLEDAYELKYGKRQQKWSAIRRILEL